MKDKLTEHFNNIYASEGFHGVIRAVEARLKLGRVKAKGNGLFCITTGGWSDDEEILDSLTTFLSLFGNKHYVGRLGGGAYYFAEDQRSNQYEIVKKGEEKVTRQEALELLLRWAVESDFGLDNIALDYLGDWDESRVQRNEFEDRTKDMSYTESLIEYARIYLEHLPEQLEEGE